MDNGYITKEQLENADFIVQGMIWDDNGGLLEWAIRNGTDINSKVQTLINEGTGLNGEILKGTELYKLIQNSTDFSSLTEE